MSPTVIQANYHFPSPQLLLSRRMTVATYFQKIRNKVVANNNGRNIPNANWHGILMGIFEDYPTLQDLLLRLPAADIANLGTLQAAIRRELFPGGETATHQQLLRDYYSCNQKVVEHPPGSGVFYPEPAISYVENQRRILAQLPDNTRPDPAVQVRRLFDGLHPSIRNAMASLAVPATLEAAIQDIMRIESNLASPAPPVASGPHHVTTNTTTGGFVPTVGQGLPPMIGPVSSGGGFQPGSAPVQVPAYQVGGSTHNPMPSMPSMPAPSAPDATMRTDLDNLRSSITDLRDSMREKETTILAEIHSLALGKRSRDDDADAKRGHYGPPSKQQQLYCPDCDMVGHSIDNCWGECPYCERRGHKVEFCTRRLRDRKRGGGGNGRGNRNGNGRNNGQGRNGGGGGGRNNNDSSKANVNVDALVKQAVQSALKKERQQEEIERRAAAALRTKNDAKGQAANAYDVDDDDE